MELDPVFVKALKYLHSKSKDSSYKLKKLLDDAIAERKGQKGDIKVSVKPVQKQQDDEKSRRHEAEKRTLDKIKQDTSDVSEEVPTKKVRKDSPHSIETPRHLKEDSKETDSTKSVEKSVKEAKENREKVKKDTEKKMKVDKEEKIKNDDTDEEDKSFDADDFACGLGIACVVCNRFDVSNGNQLVECQECHTLYHQECHKPPVTEQDVNDPRFVWYCSRCTKSMKKMVKSSKGKSSSTAFTKESPTSSSITSLSIPAAVTTSAPVMTPTSASSKSSKTDPTTLFSFRRVDNKPSGVKESSTSSVNRPLSGLASLAANLSGKTEPAKATHSRSDSKSGLVRSESLKTVKEKTKLEGAEKVSLLSQMKTSKSESAKPTTSVNYGVDIFKGLPKTSEQVKFSSKSSELNKPKVSDSVKLGSKSSSSDLSKSSKSSDGNKASLKSVPDVIKLGSKSGPEHVKSISKSSSELLKSSSKSSSEALKSSSKSSSEIVKSSSKSGSENIKSISKSADLFKSSSKPSLEQIKSISKPDQNKSFSSKISSSSSASTSSMSSSKQPQGGASSVVSADKRLQMMKKKAAAKLQEKRASLK